jgi:N4-gp56 family major capsid protein
MAAGDVTTGTYPTPFVTTASAAGFIPEIWSDEIIAAYESNLVLASLIKKMSMKGKKGDTIHIPRPYRGSASAKAASTAVTVISDETDDLTISINQHWEYSRHIEDIVNAQALSSLRQFYTSDAGYALATQLDNYLFALGTGLGNGAGGVSTTPASWVHSNTFRPSDGTGTLEAWAENTTVAADVFTDASFRDGLQYLDDNDVPMMGRFFAIPPSLANIMRGIDRYNSADFVNGQKVQTGQIGNLYGVDIYVSTNVPVIETAAQNAGASIQSRGALLAHKDVYVCAEQVGVRSQTQYQQEYLATLFTADRLYGATVFRPENGVTIAIAE